MVHESWYWNKFHNFRLCGVTKTWILHELDFPFSFTPPLSRIDGSEALVCLDSFKLSITACCINLATSGFVARRHDFPPSFTPAFSVSLDCSRSWTCEPTSRNLHSELIMFYSLYILSSNEQRHADLYRSLLYSWLFQHSWHFSIFLILVALYRQL